MLRQTFAPALAPPAHGGKGHLECSASGRPSDRSRRVAGTCEVRCGGALKADIMTANASFKKRIRARMAKTGERYGAARRVLIEQAASSKSGTRVWVTPPEQPEHTGKSWDEWCDLIESWPEADQGHAAVAARVLAEFDVTGWWGQGITVGWERITGRRLVNQMADGTFTAAVSRTITIDADALRAMLYDDADRADLFGGMASEMRSRPGVKMPRIRLDVGTVGIAIEEKANGRATVTVSHEKLTEPADVDQWKPFWTEWLEALDDG
jgi:hypothetical protein